MPERIGPYRVDGPIGKGGMGEVYRGYDERLDRPVALKRVKPDPKDPDKARRRFRREARAVARLIHTSIVPIFDWVETEDADWIVMELVDGEPLRGLMSRRSMSVARAVRLARDVAAGLAVAHEAGIIHRDLKPENVMVTRKGEAKILDFGLAKQLGRDAPPLSTLSVEGQMLGTVTAMSPEQALGHPVDPRSDLFALGILLYELVTGEIPFRGQNSMEVLTRICSARQQPAHAVKLTVPEPLSQFIDRLLEKEPARRPQSAQEVARALEQYARTLESDPDDTSGILTPAPEAWGRDSSLYTETVESAAESGIGAGVLIGSGAEIGSVLPRTVASQEGPIAAVPARRRHFTWRTGLATAAALIGLLVLGARFWPERTQDGRPEAPKATALEELDNHELYERGMALVKRAYRKGNVDQGIQCFQIMMARDEESAPAHAGLARAYWRKYYGESKDPLWLDRAIPVAERAASLDPFLSAAKISLGLVYLETGRLSEAKEEFEEILELDPKDSEGLSGLGRIANLQGDLESAETYFRRALAEDPADWELPMELGTIYYRTTRYDEAELAFLQSLEVAVDNVLAYRNLAGVYFQMNNLSRATEATQKALEIEPEPSLYSNLGTLFFAQGLYPQAVSAFEKAIETPGAPNNYLIWANLGDAYRWAPGGMEKAKDSYRQAIQLLDKKLSQQPGDTILRSRRAVYYAKQEDCPKALSDLAELDNQPASDANVLFRRVLVDELCKMRDQALEALGQALQAGYPIEVVKSDPELLRLRDDPRYHQLALKYEKQVE